MKKYLYISSFLVLGTSLYFYFRHQLKLALQYEYDIKRWKITKLTTKEIAAELVIKLVNKSAFSVDVLDYDLGLFYKGIEITSVLSTASFKILPNQSVEIPITIETEIDLAKKAILPFFMDVLAQKPIDVSVNGYVNVKFMKITQRLDFNNEKFNYSNNVLEDFQLKDDWLKLQDKFKFLKKI